MREEEKGCIRILKLSRVKGFRVHLEGLKTFTRPYSSRTLSSTRKITFFEDEMEMRRKRCLRTYHAFAVASCNCKYNESFFFSRIFFFFFLLKACSLSCSLSICIYVYRYTKVYFNICCENLMIKIRALNLK